MALPPPVPEVGVDGWIARLDSVQAGAAPAKDDVRLLGASAGAPVSSLRDDFLAGYDAAGGPEQYRLHFVDAVLPCEWSDPWGTPWYPGNGYLSIAQFHPDTWERAGGGNPNDLFTVGRNVANWLNMGVDPGGTGGWPTCWWR